MNTEEKILELLTQMQADISGLKTDVSGLKTDVSDLKTDVSGLKSDVADLSATQQTMQGDIAQIQTTLTRVAVTQENVVLKSLDALAEGQDLTHQRLKSLAGKDELADLREEVHLLRSVVAQHSRDIEALKAAQ